MRLKDICINEAKTCKEYNVRFVFEINIKNMKISNNCRDIYW